MRSKLLAVSLLTFALAACTRHPPVAVEVPSATPSSTPEVSVAPGTIDEAAINASARELFGGQEASDIQMSVIPGLVQVTAMGDIFYASPDGKYFMRADIIEVATRQSMTEAARRGPRMEAMAEINLEHSITFPAVGEEKHEILVFTDTDCGFCRRFHEEIDQYTSRGITIHYMPWPRSGAQGPVYDTMQSVWCANGDQAQRDALTRAKRGEAVRAATCENPIAEVYALGQRMGINGTPAVFDMEGNQYGGYVPAEDLFNRLEAAVNGPADTTAE